MDTSAIECLKAFSSAAVAAANHLIGSA